MINGIHTYGVYGAAKCFSLFDEQDIPSNNCKEVIEKLGDDPNFTIILRTKIIHRKVMTPRINRKDLIASQKGRLRLGTVRVASQNSDSYGCV